MMLFDLKGTGCVGTSFFNTVGVSDPENNLLTNGKRISSEMIQNLWSEHSHAWNIHGTENVGQPDRPSPLQSQHRKGVTKHLYPDNFILTKCL